MPNEPNIALTRDDWGRLVLQAPDGRRFVGVEPVRAFPLTDPDGWVAFVDEDGREVWGLADRSGLSPETDALLNEELRAREFVPQVLRIVGSSGDMIPAVWEVETDRGPTRFTIDNDEDVRRLGPTRALVTDDRKLRYHVPDTRALDPFSARTLERFL